MMKEKKKPFRKFTNIIKSIPLTDKFLLLFLFILLLQSCFHLFCYEKLPADDETIDVMMRSCMATIFGYFISAGFGHHTKNDGTQNVSAITSKTITTDNQDTTTAKKIGFVAEETEPTLPPQPEESTPPNPFTTKKQQALIVAVFGFLALVVVCVFRMFYVTETYAIPILSQLQDFVVGSIGFLVGYQKYDLK